MVMSIYLLINHTDLLSLHTNQYLYLLALGVIPQTLGFTLYIFGQKYINVIQSSISLILEPITVVILELIIFKVNITEFQYSGMLVIAYCIYLSNKYNNE